MITDTDFAVCAWAVYLALFSYVKTTGGCLKMDDPRIEMVTNLEKYRIGIDDTFSFKCRECGACCRQREDILLNTRDLFNIAAKLGLTMEQAIEKYCDVYVGHDSRIPIARIKPQGLLRTCPLLQGGRCIVHDMKPVVCALFPVGRVLMYGNPESGEAFDEEQLVYIINDFVCGGRRKKQTVRSWLEQFNIPVEDEYFFMWHRIVKKLSEGIRAFEEAGATEKAMDMLWGGVFAGIYVDYDTKAEFMPQFVANAEKLQHICEGLVAFVADIATE